MHLVDDHCHPFSLTHTPLELDRITLDAREGPEEDARRRRLGPDRLVQELFTVRLARFFDCAPEELPEVREAAARDWPAYVRRLLDDAGIAALIWDAATLPGAARHLADYTALAGRPLHPLYRIDPLVDRLIEDGAGSAEIVLAVSEGLHQARREDAAVGAKTVLAYRTGLAVRPEVGEEEADRSLGDRSVPVRRRGAACRALVLRRALGVAAELDLPFQIHTGFGDSDLRLAEADPLLLEPLLRTPEGEAAQIVLLHSSYPWHEEAAYLAATRPNVHADFSLACLFAPATSAERLLRMLDLAPASKLLLGTDAHLTPETYWFGAHVVRAAWLETARRLQEQGVRRAWLERAERRLFFGNAIDLYGIPDPIPED
ncbi:MAG: amidohydrolase family protein [Candidatus Dormibacteraceae bacterium]